MNKSDTHKKALYLVNTLTQEEKDIVQDNIDYFTECVGGLCLEQVWILFRRCLII